MALKIQTIKNFLGFGEGTKNGEYYFSVGMRHRRGGIEPGWHVVESADSSDISSSSGYGVVQEFTERLEGGNAYNYAIDENGVIAKVQALGNAWTRQWIPALTAGKCHGAGLITDHSSSQRVLYIQDEYVGSWDGSVHYDQFMDLGWALNIKKSPDIYEDWVVVPNGSTVALLNVTDDSMTYSGFTLPVGFVCTAARAGANGVLLGANFNNKGVLILWDCLLDRSIAPWIWLDGIFAGMAKYKGIWVVATNRQILLTNGYSVLETYPIPDIGDTSLSFGPTIPSGMKVDEDKLIIGASVTGVNRRKKGFYILDFKTGLWEFAPLSTKNVYSNADTGAVFINSSHRKLVSYGDTFISPNKDYIGRLMDSDTDSYFIAEVGSGDDRKKRAEAIILNLGFPLQDYTTVDNPNWKISVKLYDFSRLLWGYAQAKVGSAAAINITIDDTVFNLNAQVGDEVTILEGLNAGEVRHIASMTGAGTNTEVWTLDSALPNLTEINAYVSVAPFKKVGEKTLTTYDIHEDRLFFPINRPVIGRKFLVKVLCEMDYMRPHINSLSFIYDDLAI